MRNEEQTTREVHLDIDYLQLSVTLEGETAQFEDPRSMDSYLDELWQQQANRPSYKV